MALKKFEVTSIPLFGTNLIEASAGTGKTYSVALMVVRFVLEQNLLINEILLVTFTNAAVRELQDRVRLFLKEANHFALDGECSDVNIQLLVEKSFEKNGVEETQQKLSKALLLMDEAMIVTIHSFCQKILSEFSFETGQNTQIELAQNQDALLLKLVNEYWRKTMPSLDVTFLSALEDLSFGRSELVNAVGTLVKGIQFKSDTFKSVKLGLAEFLSARLNSQAVKDRGYKFLEASYAEMVKCSKKFEGLTTGVELFDALKEVEKRKPKYLSKIPDVLDVFHEIIAANDLVDRVVIKIFCTLINECFVDIVGKLKEIKKRKGIYSFDDLINILRDAILADVEGVLRDRICWKFKAVFIDEFQDTDKKQYDIFHKTFHGKRPLYYIGDPKQAIYSFRQADLELYKLAASQADEVYTMGTNYRSTPDLIKALNSFFQPEESFDTFLDSTIRYQEVVSGKKDVEILQSGIRQSSLRLFISEKNQPSPVVQLANDVMLLLTKGTIDGEEIKPSAVGVLVRKSKDGFLIKQELAKRGIPAVIENKNHVLNTHAAKLIVCLFDAILHPSLQTINGVLFSDLTAFTPQELSSKDVSPWLNIFFSAQQRLIDQGVYSTFKYLFSQLDLHAHFHSGTVLNEVRTWSNLNQIIEILHQHEDDSQKSGRELRQWMLSYGDESKADDQIYEQHIDSDFEAVNIITIHKSKGLAYDFVFAHGLAMSAGFKATFSSMVYRDPVLEDYTLTYDINEHNKEFYKHQEDQESRRLLYVALTRAKFCVNIYANYFGYKNTVLAEFEGAGGLTRSEQFEVFEGRYESVEKINELTVLKQASVNTDWQMQSYSKLNDRHFTYQGDRLMSLDEYSHFVYRDLAKGAMAGEFLHFIFEFIDYKAASNIAFVLEKAKSLYPSVYVDDLEGFYKKLINHVLSAKLISDRFEFSIAEIGQNVKELEFYFDFDRMDKSLLCSIIPGLELGSVLDCKGIFTGFIDLFFEFNGQYFILDWKSNFLGESLEGYEGGDLNKAIVENNYHLQYHLYCLAVHRYLKSRLSSYSFKEHFGGVFYLFIRGLRSGKNSGVFYAEIPEERIMKLDKLFGME